MAYIEDLQNGTVIHLTGLQTLIGRSQRCEVVLDDHTVSRQHASIRQEGGQFFLRDLSSRNGTLLDGERLSDEALLFPGSTIEICDQTWKFWADDADDELSSHTVFLDPGITDDGSAIVSEMDVRRADQNQRLTINTSAKLAALLQITSCLKRTLDQNTLFSNTLDELFTIFPQADQGRVLLLEKSAYGKNTRSVLVTKAVKSRTPGASGELRVSRTLVQRALDERCALLSADVGTDSRFNISESIVDLNVRSMICAPLVVEEDQDGKTEEEPLGVILLYSSNPNKRFLENDLEVLVAVAAQVTLAVENSKMYEVRLREDGIAKELDMARQVQLGFLPDTIPNIPGYQFDGRYQAAQSLSGDYYDYIPLPDGRWAVVAADVAGHGVAASLLMAKLSAETRFAVVSDPQPAKAMEALDEALTRKTGNGRMVTAVICILDPEKHTVTLCNAAHMPVLHKKENGSLVQVGTDTSGPPLGFFRGEERHETTVHLKPGELLFLYSDGITDAQNLEERPYTCQRFEKFLRETPHYDVAILGSLVFEELRRHMGDADQVDDICLVCFGRERE